VSARVGPLRLWWVSALYALNFQLSSLILHYDRLQICRPERVDVLEHEMLRFTQASALNDPFEANPCFGNLEDSLIERQLELIESQPATDVVKTAARMLIPSRVRQSLREFQIQLGSEILVLSLTQDRNNLIMWSHYADYHKGFVIGFDSQSDFFRVHNGKLVTPLTEVKYSENRPLLPTFDDFPNFRKELAEIVIFNKSLCSYVLYRQLPGDYADG